MIVKAEVCSTNFHLENVHMITVLEFQAETGTSYLSSFGLYIKRNIFHALCTLNP